MRTSVVVSLVLVVVVGSAHGALFSYTDGFETYIGRTVHSGVQQFKSPDEPLFASSGWFDYHQNGTQYDPAAITASGGPHVGSTPSGWLDTQGLANFDASGPPHGAVHVLPGPVGPNQTVVVEVKANASGNPDSGTNYMSVGNSAMSDGVGGDYRSGINFKLAAGVSSGKLYSFQLGPEPAMTNVPDLSQGWVEMRIEVDVDASALATEVRGYTRTAGSVGAWTFMGSYGTGSSPGWTPSHIAIQPAKWVTMDDLVIEIIPEPVSLSLLALGGVLALIRRR